MTTQIPNTTSSYGTASRSKRRGPVASSMTIVGVLLAVVLALSACGSAGASDTSSQANDETTDEETSEGDPTLDFYQCLRDNGLDVSDGSGLESLDTSDPAVSEIVQHCAQTHLGNSDGRVTVGGNGGQMGDNLAETESLIAYVDCLRDHGFDVPDPSPDGRLNLPEGFDPNSPPSGWQEASQDCAPHLDGGGILMGDGSGGGVARNDN